jgi:alanine racemase
MDSRPTVAEIDLAALRHNFRQICNVVDPGAGILAVVKADAYGHGFMDVAAELESLGVTAFGVAFLAEGIQLRKAGIDRPVLVLGGIYPGQERKCVGFSLSSAVFTIEQAAALDEAARRLYRKAKLHLKVDTGMGRLGVGHGEAPAFLAELRRMRNVELEGIFSHFASADELDDDGRRYTETQSERFSAVVSEAKRIGFSPTYVHLANSAAAFSVPLPFCNLVRPGIVLYGSLPSPDFRGRMDLRPVMRLRSRVAMLKWIEPGTCVSYARRFTAEKRTLLASVPVGYADGYPRALTNRSEVLIRGERARVVGTVCMDWFMVDVTGIVGVTVGDEVTLLGCDAGGKCIAAEELAELAGTIPYEIFCGISKRVPRIYLNPSK